LALLVKSTPSSSTINFLDFFCLIFLFSLISEYNLLISTPNDNSILIAFPSPSFNKDKRSSLTLISSPVSLDSIMTFSSIVFRVVLYKSKSGVLSPIPTKFINSSLKLL